MVLSSKTEGDGGCSSLASCCDRIRILRHKLRSLVEKNRDSLVYHRAALAGSLFADHVDSDLRNAFQNDFKPLIDEIGEAVSKIQLAHRNTPPSPGEATPTPAISFIGAGVLVQEGGTSCLLERARMWTAVSS